MRIKNSRTNSKSKSISIGRIYDLLARHAYSVIISAALFCNIAAKLFHSWANNLLSQYFEWILSDIAVLLSIEVAVSVICFRWPRKRVIRTVLIFSAIVCTWSVMNAGWLIRTGTQILPAVLLPLFRDPLNALTIIGVNLVKMPVAAAALLGPSAIALVFFFSVLAKPKKPDYNHDRFLRKTLISFVLILVFTVIHSTISKHSSAPAASAGMRYNCQLKAVTGFFSPNSRQLAGKNAENATRVIPAFDQINLEPSKLHSGNNYNVVIIVLEGIQYRHTSLYNKQNNLTPYMLSLAKQGVEFSNARTVLTHTTKSLFSILTGRFPSASQDLAEAVPVSKPYAGIATILKQNLNYRTVFFQSAKGAFECRPGLVYNLGFEKFFAREDLNDPNVFIGYLGSDEFAMLAPITEWIQQSSRPFLLTILCSVTHDPYEAPAWFAEPAKEPVQRYRQAIYYTDRFIQALDTELAKLKLSDKTIFCIIGDHGEAFGEHGLHGHERIAFEEVLHIPWVMRAPFLLEEQTRITAPVSTIDFTPTLLELLGFDTNKAGFDGIDALAAMAADRKVYFSGWIQQGPAGFASGNYKYIYDPTNQLVSAYDLNSDPFELIRLELDEVQTKTITDDVTSWRRGSIFCLKKPQNGKKVLFNSWLCRWNNRISSAKHISNTKD